MYYIADRHTYTDAVNYVNENTTGLDNICITMLPDKCKEKNPTQKKFFVRRYEAQEYLDVIRQLQRRNDEQLEFFNAWYSSKRMKTIWKVYKTVE